MYAFLVFIHVLVSIALTVVILLQSSKGGGLAGVFGGGGGGMGTVFGGRGVASFLSKLTTGLAIAFLIICLILGKITSGEEGGSAQQKALQRARSNSIIPIHESESTTGETPSEAPMETPGEN